MSVRRRPALAWRAAAAVVMLLAALRVDAAEEPDCDAWLALSRDNRLEVMGSVIEQNIGPPESSALAACLWSVYDQIADHTTGACMRDGGSYGAAVRAALDTAVEFCDQR